MRITHWTPCLPSNHQIFISFFPDCGNEQPEKRRTIKRPSGGMSHISWQVSYVTCLKSQVS